MAKKRIPELKIEVVNDRANYLFLSLLEYKREIYLCVIDNISDSEIGAYVLDFAEQEGIHVGQFLSKVVEWFYARSEKHPLSVELARLGLTEAVAPIYRTFDASYVARIVGQSFIFDKMHVSKVKRRRVIPIPEGIAVKLKNKSSPI